MAIGEQNTFNNSLRQVEVRLRLIDGPPLYGGTRVRNQDDAVDLMRVFLGDLDREYFCVVCLDSKGEPLNFNVVNIGDIASSLVSIQNVFKVAILQNSPEIICFHNHPSGNAEPSDLDYVVTKRLAAVGNLLNISVIDHIIIGAGGESYYSFKKCEPDLLKTVAVLEQSDKNCEIPDNEVFAAENTSEDVLSVKRHR